MTKYPSTLQAFRSEIAFKITGLFNFLAGLASIVGFYISIKIIDGAIVNNIYAIFLMCLVVALILYIWFWHSKRLHRYAQASIYVHYVNHIIRDSLAKINREVKKGNYAGDALTEEVWETTDNVLSSIATCFNLLSGIHCCVCIKNFNTEHKTIDTFRRDPISKEYRKAKKNSKEEYEREVPIQENTGFRVLVEEKEPTKNRYFCCNNLPRSWRKGKYENTSFKRYGKPQKIKIFNIQIDWERRWTLPYKSTLILPIRYVNEELQAQHYKGFLCIDAASKNIFKPKHCFEVGGAFADILYIYLSEFSRISNLLEGDGTVIKE